MRRNGRVLLVQDNDLRGRTVAAEAQLNVRVHHWQVRLSDVLHFCGSSHKPRLICTPVPLFASKRLLQAKGHDALLVVLDAAIERGLCRPRR